MPKAHSSRRVWLEKGNDKWRQQKRQINKRRSRKRKRGGGTTGSVLRVPQKIASFLPAISLPAFQRCFLRDAKLCTGCAAITSLAGQARPTRQSGLEEGTTQTTPGKAAVTLNPSPAVLPEEKKSMALRRTRPVRHRRSALGFFGWTPRARCFDRWLFWRMRMRRLHGSGEDVRRRFRRVLKKESELPFFFFLSHDKH